MSALVLPHPADGTSSSQQSLQSGSHNARNHLHVNTVGSAHHDPFSFSASPSSQHHYDASIGSTAAAIAIENNAANPEMTAEEKMFTFAKPSFAFQNNEMFAFANETNSNAQTAMAPASSSSSSGQHLALQTRLPPSPSMSLSSTRALPVSNAHTVLPNGGARAANTDSQQKRSATGSVAAEEFNTATKQNAGSGGSMSVSAIPDRNKVHVSHGLTAQSELPKDKAKWKGSNNENSSDTANKSCCNIL